MLFLPGNYGDALLLALLQIARGVLLLQKRFLMLEIWAKFGPVLVDTDLDRGSVDRRILNCWPNTHILCIFLVAALHPQINVQIKLIELYYFLV